MGGFFPPSMKPYVNFFTVTRLAGDKKKLNSVNYNWT